MGRVLDVVTISVLGERHPFILPGYSIALLPAFLFLSYGAYAAAKVLNSLYVSSIVFPVHLIARSASSSRIAIR